MPLISPVKTSEKVLLILSISNKYLLPNFVKKVFFNPLQPCRGISEILKFLWKNISLYSLVQFNKHSKYNKLILFHKKNSYNKNNKNSNNNNKNQNKRILKNKKLQVKIPLLITIFLLVILKKVMKLNFYKLKFIKI